MSDLSQNTSPVFQIFAEREFTTDENEIYTLQIAKPYYSVEYGYVCPFRIHGPEFSKVVNIYGGDSMQALKHAMETIPVYINSDPVLKDKLRWIGTDLGFTFQNH